ncbi:MAG: hypothetical protein HYX68_06340 [Planctomycetes bacterium]|nr:hypothetical protein [Planctomycetota bacterium]
MRAKFEEFASVFFSALGLAFVALGILVVPADAFAAYNGECSSCQKSSTRSQCASDCCSTFKDDLTARCQCCNDACGDDTECLKRCAEEACGGDLECAVNCVQQKMKKCAGDGCELPGLPCFIQWANLGKCDGLQTLCRRPGVIGCDDCFCVKIINQQACGCRLK